MDYDKVVEVKDTGSRRANRLLEKGWRLLGFVSCTWGVVFILGRPEGVAPEAPQEEYANSVPS